MNPLPIAGALALSLLLAACGERSTVPPDTRSGGEANRASQAEPAYSASGTVTAVAGDAVTISHGPVEGLGWPAMTMSFRAGAPEMIQGIRAGDRIAFEFRQADDSYTLISVTKAQ